MSKRISVNDPSLLPTLLLVLFIGLKLTGQITWSWWWVMSPVWIPIAIALLIVFFWGLAKAMQSARRG